MAINSSHVIKNKIDPKELCGALSQTSNVPSHVMTLTITTTQSSINSDSSRIARKKGLTSPYLAGDKVKVSRVTEKKIIHKQPFVPSFPLATNIYKANSDEFRISKRNNKKVKKSVLTLPNESSTDGIVGTVSDVNDVTEYNKEQRDRDYKIKSKKRLPIQNRKPRIRNKDLYYDRDARYCSQMNIDLDCSSTDMIKHYDGDGRRVSKKNTVAKVSETESKLDPHDVWAVLRNINQFQFTPSPPMSDYSIQSRKKKRTNKKRQSRKDTRVIETCRTEEFAYISSFDLNRSRTSFTPTSSIDRITVIDKQDEFSEFCKEFDNKFTKTTNSKDAKITKVRNKKPTPCNNNVNFKRNNKIAKSKSKSGNQLVAFEDKKVAFEDKKVVSNSLNAEQLHFSAIETVGETFTYGTQSHDSAQVCVKDDDDIKEITDNVSTELEFSNVTVCSVNSGSSKAGLHDFVNKKKAEKSKPIYSDESNQQLKGITKVAVVSKAPEATVSKRSTERTPIRKPRLVTTMPTSKPKLTQTEVKRRLANMKFPIVILEKDELGCSSIEVPMWEPIQFRGLTENIWPFMKDWDDDKEKSPTLQNTSKIIQQEKEKQTMTRNNNNLVENKTVMPKDKKFYIYNMKRTDLQRHNIVQESKHTIQQQLPRPKPMKQLKDKMLKLLYKKSAEDFKHINNRKAGQSVMTPQRLVQNKNVEKQTTTVDTDLDAMKMSYQPPIQINQRLPSPNKIDPKQITPPITPPITRHPWARGKWASDFIESVIKKIKSGIYYNQENKIVCKKCCKVSKEVSIQTALTLKREEDLGMISEIVDVAKPTNEHKAIPGFDDALAPVEIKTLNMKQITVKHCLTNVLLQFDVCIPTDKKPLSFESPKYIYAPLTNTESNAKIIKCKTSIINSIMPAELCSIIPKMMRNISDFNTNFQFTFPPILPRKQEFQLATITELTQPNSVDSFKYYITPFSFMSKELRSFLRGKYGHVLNIMTIHLKKTRNMSHHRFIVTNLINKIDIVPLLSYQHIFYENAIELTARQLCNPLIKNKILPQTEPNNCMALQPYIAPKQFVAPTFDINNVTKLLQDICFNNVVVNFDFPKYFPMSLSDIKITVHRKSSPKSVREVSSIKKLNSIFDGFLKTNHLSEQSCFEKSVKCIEYGKQSCQSLDKKQRSSQNTCHVKTKKKCFVKLYKKCKSTSNIALEKTSTALSKITNLDHFLQALGSGKLLSSIFDGYVEKKILSSIAEMKNWITDISQRQAMLVLLLTNKKDTPNLIRYRPVLLQGIAVNRITRASELDMEIEVIETENLNKLSHYEGISYVNASVQNNNLIEELYWIAKTTASDYQKPFDESSERLLKSLTEKRKTLNPSYLRVMARYVGLGLLKPPKK